jgi:hypothetical protein
MATNRAEIPRTKGATTGFVWALESTQVDLNRGVAVFTVRPPDKSNPLLVEVPLRQITPDTSEDQSELWEKLVETLIASRRADGSLPSFFRGFEVQKGEDSTGDPALYVTILVSPTPGPADDATVAERSVFADSLQNALLQLRLQRYPYVRLGEWRRKR